MVLLAMATTDDLTADSALCVLVSGSPELMYDPSVWLSCAANLYELSLFEKLFCDSSHIWIRSFSFGGRWSRPACGLMSRLLVAAAWM
jgi:hypothetical protein